MRCATPQIDMMASATVHVRRRVALGMVAIPVLSPWGCAGAGSDSGAPLRTAIAITHVSIVDVEQGRLVPDQTVVMRDGRIAAVGPAVDITLPADADVLDGTGRFLAPGLADMHVHLYTEGDLFTYVANGVTTVRNMAGDTSHLGMRARVASGQIIGPRIITAGPVVEAAPLSHPDNVLLESPRAVRAELGRQGEAGYDFVKVYNQLARPVYDSVIVVARALGTPVAGHVPLEVGLDGALAARQASIEHFRGYIQALLPPSAALPNDTSFRDGSVAWTRIDETRIASLVARTVAAGVWNVPTFTFTVHELSPAAEHAQLLARREVRHLSLAGLPRDRATTSYLRQFTEADYLAAQRGLEGQFRLVRGLEAAGAGLLVGTDSWLAGYAFADELELLVRSGLTPARVLRMATLDAARFLGEQADWGVVAAGRRGRPDPARRGPARRHPERAAGAGGRPERAAAPSRGPRGADRSAPGWSTKDAMTTGQCQWPDGVTPDLTRGGVSACTRATTVRAIVRAPVCSRISKRLYRHISQSVCPWNVKFSQELAEDSPFRAREFIAGKDAVTLATDILALDQEQFSAAFRKSPMKRAKLAGLRRNAAVVLGTLDTLT